MKNSSQRVVREEVNLSLLRRAFLQRAKLLLTLGFGVYFENIKTLQSSRSVRPLQWGRRLRSKFHVTPHTSHSLNIVRRLLIQMLPFLSSRRARPSLLGRILTTQVRGLILSNSRAYLVSCPAGGVRAPRKSPASCTANRRVEPGFRADTAGNWTVTLSLMEAIESSVMYCALRTATSSFCPTRIAPNSRVTASLLGKMPNLTNVAGGISPKVAGQSHPK